MRYYKTGLNKTLYLSWAGGNLFSGQRRIFYANQTIGKEFGSRQWECADPRGIWCGNTRSAIQVRGEYNGSSCCGFGASRGGILQYRAYGCLPMTYNQLMKGVLITPGKKWATVRRALDIPNNRGGYIAIVAFFIPTKQDRLRKGLRPTFSMPSGSYGTRLVLAPSCTPTLWGPSNCTDGIQDDEEHYGIDRVRKPCIGNSILW